MFRRKSLIYILAIAGISLLSFTYQAKAEANINRIAGGNRYETAIAVAKDGWTQADSAILAYGENYPDALAAAPLAKKMNAPILLTTKDTLIEGTKQVLIDLKVKNVYIVGGVGVLSQEVENQLKAMGIGVNRLAGKDRYETSVKIAEQLGDVKELAITTGSDFPNALSVASIAAKKNMPILLVAKDSVPDSVKGYAWSHRASKTYIIGNHDDISTKVETAFDNVERIAGIDKYDTNMAVLMKFYKDYSYDTIHIATGENFADALAGTASAGKNGEPIFLINQDVSAANKGLMIANLQTIKKIDVLGGEGAVQSSVIVDLKDRLKVAEKKVDTYTSDDAIYVGEAEEDQPNGMGMMISKSGDMYTGQVKDGVFEGKGCYAEDTGYRYVGSFSGNKYQGKGTEMEKNGIVYSGEWRDNKKNGKGTERRPSGEKYDGYWSDDQRNGQGVCVFEDGAKYDGDWKNNKRSGVGTETYSNGDMYVGQWENDEKNGQGTYTWADGDKYIGEIKNGLKNGKGKYIFADGHIREGIWVDDVFQK